MKRNLKQKKSKYLFCEYWPNTTFWKIIEADSTREALEKFTYYKTHIYIDWNWPESYNFIGITPEGYSHYQTNVETIDAYERSTWRQIDFIFKLLWQNEYYS